MAKSHGGARKGAGRKPGQVSEAKKALSESAAEHGERALNVLLEVMDDQEQPGNARINAANAILDRGYGKPPQHVEHGGLSDLAQALIDARSRSARS